MTAEAGRTWAVRQVVRPYPIAVTVGDKTDPTSLLACWSEERPAEAVLAITDPFATEERVVEWVVGRSLLVSAHLPAHNGVWVGMGDVRVKYLGGSTLVELSSPEGTCTLVMRGEVLKDFLRASAEIIPFGSIEESAIYAVQIDRGLAALLDGAA